MQGSSSNYSETDPSELLNELARRRALPLEGYERLISSRTEKLAEQAAELAMVDRRRIYGNEVFVRGLIEFTNFCTNDCLYCGIRRSNENCQRYRLTQEEILECCRQGWEMGFRTFVLQGGEDPLCTDHAMCELIGQIKRDNPGCAVTLSIGERSAESYRALHEAGADRYLLRHETANREHYSLLHPPEMSLDTRIQCLINLRKAGFTIGAGFMVGSPFQTPRTLAEDLKLIETLRPEMCGIGPFIPHHATPLGEFPRGTVELTCFLLSLIRLISPSILLPATTALGTIDDRGREKGILSGANVVMPNLSPISVRSKYEIYENKLGTGAESAQALEELSTRMRDIGFRIVVDRGDPRFP